MAKDPICDMTGLDLDKRKAMCKYYSTMPEADRIEAHRLQGDLIRQYRNRIPPGQKDPPEYYYSMLILALWKMDWTRHCLSQKSPSLSLEEADEIAIRRLSTFRAQKAERKNKTRPKANNIDKRLYLEIKKLREKKLSWRDVAIYLKQFHSFKISHVYLKEVYDQIAQDRAKRGDNDGRE